MANSAATRTTREKTRDRTDQTERARVEQKKAKKVEEAPDPALPSEDIKLCKIDSSKLIALAGRLKKLMGEPETVKVSIGKEITIAADYNSGSLILHDPTGVVEYSAKPIRFMVPFVVLTSALAKRGVISMGVVENMLHLKGNRYRAELNIERSPADTEFTPMKGQDSEPLKRCLAEARNYLSISDMIEGTSIDAHFKWGEGMMIAAAADAYHAVIVHNKIETHSAHQVTMPLDLAAKLSDIGGQFDIGENRVQAESEIGRAEINQIGSSDTVIPLENIRGLMQQKSSWKAEINSGGLLALLDNLYAVVEWNQRIELAITDRALKINSSGRYGKVAGSVEMAPLKGDSPERLTVNNAIFYSIVSKLSGNIYLSLIGNVLRIEPVEQSEWKFIGFVSLSANEG